MDASSFAGDHSHNPGDAVYSVSSVDPAPWRKELVIPESLRILTDPRHNISSLSTTLSSGLKLPQLSPDTTERVFPIRSVVSVDTSAPSSTRQTPSLESSEWQTSPLSESSWCFSTGGDRSRSQSITPSICNLNATALRDNPDIAWDAASKEIFSDTCPTNLANSVPSFLTGCDGFLADPASPIIKDSAQFAHRGQSGRRASTHRVKDRLEEIRRLQSVYSFGALLVLQESEPRKLTVQVSSKNSGEVIGHTPEELFRLDSFCNILRQDKTVEFLSHTKSIRDKCYSVEQHGPDVLDLTITAADGKSNDFWCTLHATKEADYMICEIEPQKSTVDSAYHNHSNNKQMHGTEVSGDAYEEVDDASEALRVFRMLRGSKNGFEYSSILNAVSRIIQLTSTAESIDVLFNRVIKILKDLTGFNKTTVYRFDSDWNGIAVADLADSEFSGDTYEDMHFLGSAFSEDLRTLHLRNKVRLSYNHGHYSPAELVYRQFNPTSQLDTNFCYLSMGSPAPLELLSCTPVEACVSIRINVFGKLWGLVSCKSYVKGARLLPPLQKICSLISDTLSSNIERLSYTLPFQMAEKGSSPQEAGQRDAAPAMDILSLFGASYAASSIVGETKIIGKPSDSQEVLALVEYLKMREFKTIVWSTDINNDFQDLNYPPGFKHISCLLFIPLSADGRDFIIFFRTSQWREITWASHSKHAMDDRSKTNIPLKEDVLCRPDGWSAVDLGKASVLSLIYKTFAEVWQQKETAMQNTQLMRLLLANCAHEFRTPLNAIINYLEIALDGSLNQETRDNLSRSHSASKSLIYIINDLLDLTNAENGQSLIKDEVFDLSATIGEATHIFGEEAKQKKVDLRILQHTSLPLVLGDQRRVRQVIMNLISNAVQHTSNGSVVIESCVPPDLTDSGTIGIEVAIHDTGTGMSQEAVETLFCELEEVSNEDYLQSSKCCRSKVDDTTGESKNVLGLGLALVARIVRNMDGRLILKSEQGIGSCFKIRLRFPLPLSQSENCGKRTKTKDSEPMSPGQQSNLCEENSSSTTGLHCENECSSRYGENIQKNNTNADINIAMNTESSELTHHSDTKTMKHQHEQNHYPPNTFSIPYTPKASTTDLNPLDQDTTEKKERFSTGEGHEKQSQASTKPTSKHIDSMPPKSEKPSLHVLVAEDDPINSTIVRKRLEKLGHTVYLTVNGKECATAYRENPSSYDALLMDIQVIP